jgi:hypothetical protein
VGLVEVEELRVVGSVWIALLVGRKLVGGVCFDY